VIFSFLWEYFQMPCDQYKCIYWNIIHMIFKQQWLQIMSWKNRKLNTCIVLWHTIIKIKTMFLNYWTFLWLHAAPLKFSAVLEMWQTQYGYIPSITANVEFASRLLFLFIRLISKHFLQSS